jgi:hypothetical protein
VLGLVALAPPLLLRDAVALVAELAVVRLREAVAFIFGVLLCLRVACCVTLGDSWLCCLLRRFLCQGRSVGHA